MNLVNLKRDQAQQFIHVSPQWLRNKVVLKVDEQGLRFVPLADTSFFEIVQAWFGYGSLSLTNIVDFISKNAEAVNRSLENEDISKEDFLTRVRDCSFSHNNKYLNRKVNSFALEIMLRDLSRFSSATQDVKSVIIKNIEPPLPKDMARVTLPKIRKNGRKLLNIALISKCFNAMISDKLGIIRTVGLLMSKYFVRNEYDETYIGTDYDLKAHPQLIDAVCTQHSFSLTNRTHGIYDESIEDDIRQIVTLTPQSLNCMTEIRCRKEVSALYLACSNKKVPLSIIQFLLENGANPDHEILITSLHQRRTILEDLDEEGIDPIRLNALKELFQKYKAKNPNHIEEI